MIDIDEGLIVRELAVREPTALLEVIQEALAEVATEVPSDEGAMVLTSWRLVVKPGTGG